MSYENIKNSFLNLMLHSRHCQHHYHLWFVLTLMIHPMNRGMLVTQKQSSHLAEWWCWKHIRISLQNTEHYISPCELFVLLCVFNHELVCVLYFYMCVLLFTYMCTRMWICLWVSALVCVSVCALSLFKQMNINIVYLHSLSSRSL